MPETSKCPDCGESPPVNEDNPNLIAMQKRRRFVSQRRSKGIQPPAADYKIWQWFCPGCGHTWQVREKQK